MRTDEIKNTLKQLHGDLEGAENVDPELRRQLLELDQDIHRLLDPEDEEVSEAEGIIARVDEVAAEFASRHPATERFLRQVAHMLGRMGI